jgi:hypothetical protein
VFRSLRTSVDEARKVVRVECFTGELDVGEREENNVQSTIQCWVLPDFDSYGTEQEAIDAAADESFDMAKAIYTAIAPNMDLNGMVCTADFREFETGQAKLGSAQRGVTYLDGVINRAEEG